MQKYIQLCGKIAKSYATFPGISEIPEMIYFQK